ncbi:hypothetical protein ACN47E_004438 [Coniothyrium glycines]
MSANPTGSGPPAASLHPPSEAPPADTTTGAPGASDSAPAPPSPGSPGEGNLESVLHLEPDTGDNSDNDSAFDANSSSSTSLASSILNYEYFNGRRYHGFRQGSYVLPNDEQEQDRLDLLHHIFLLILGGKLYDAPIPPAPRRVLDIGTGTGIWAIDFADENPGAEVIGTDLSPIQPTWVPPNVKFYIDDAESEWVYGSDEKFDFIHCRTMAGSIGDWAKLLRQCYTHLQPGGYLELQEPLALVESDDGTLEQAVHIRTWQRIADEASAIIKKDIYVGTSLKQRMIDQGFVDVHEKTVKVPIGPWPKDPKMKEIGRYQREHMAMGIEPYTLGLAGKILGWSEPECRVLIAKVVGDVRNRAYHTYIRFIFVYGRKPESSAH